MDTSDTSRRRSLRRREEKSYTEIGEPEYLIDDDSSPNSPVKSNAKGGASVDKHSNSELPNNHRSTTNNHHSTISNGDVEMESEESDDDGPLEPLPLPKVRKTEVFFNLSLESQLWHNCE